MSQVRSTLAVIIMFLNTTVCVKGKNKPIIHLSGFEITSKEFLLKVSWSEFDLTSCSARQSNMAVSRWRLNSVEFSNRWIPTRSLCIMICNKEKGTIKHIFPLPGIIVCYFIHLPQQWEKLAQKTAAIPGSGFAWWSKIADILSKTIEAQSPTTSHAQTPTTDNERILLRRGLFVTDAACQQIIWC